MNTKTRRTNKYPMLDDASYEALMESRNIYPYISEESDSYVYEDVYARDYKHAEATTWK